ncbi:MAG: hypothetical protein V1806_11155 [Pseudomonadota bacterium]
MDQDCYIKIGDDCHYGLEAAKLLGGLRDRQQIEICLRGCSETDKQLMLAIYEKWREDSNKWKKYRLAVFAVLGGLLLVVAYLGGFLDQLLAPDKLAAGKAPAPASEGFFADKASLNTFLGTITVILAAIAFFVRRLAAKAELERAGTRLKDTELSRRLAQGYNMTLGDDKLLLTPRPQ